MVGVGLRDHRIRTYYKVLLNAGCQFLLMLKSSLRSSSMS